MKRICQELDACSGCDPGGFLAQRSREMTMAVDPLGLAGITMIAADFFSAARGCQFLSIANSQRLETNQAKPTRCGSAQPRAYGTSERG